MTLDTKPVVCVFCGASSGSSPAHIEAARSLGRLIAEKDMKLGKSSSDTKSPLYFLPC